MKKIINPHATQGIYAIVNTVNNKIYIGSSIHLQKRYKEHIYQLKNNIHFNQHLQNSFNKYGNDAFKFIILEYTNNDILKHEQKWIDAFPTQLKYNMAEVAGRPARRETNTGILYLTYIKVDSHYYYTYNKDDISITSNDIHKIKKSIPTHENFTITDPLKSHQIYYMISHQKIQKTNSCGVKGVVAHEYNGKTRYRYRTQIDLYTKKEFETTKGLRALEQKVKNHGYDWIVVDQMLYHTLLNS